MATLDEQNAFRIFLRLLAVAQFSLAVIAAASLRLVFMLYGDAAARAAHPNNGAEILALASYRPVFVSLLGLGVLAVLGGLISGVCMWRRRARGFSRLIAALSLLLFPIGTAIGVATLIGLGQKPIRDLYKT